MTERPNVVHIVVKTGQREINLTYDNWKTKRCAHGCEGGTGWDHSEPHQARQTRRVHKARQREINLTYDDWKTECGAHGCEGGTGWYHSESHEARQTRRVHEGLLQCLLEFVLRHKFCFGTGFGRRCRDSVKFRWWCWGEDFALKRSILSKGMHCQWHVNQNQHADSKY